MITKIPVSLCIGTSPRIREYVNTYVNNEKYDGYIRDSCVFRNEIDIWDKMSANCVRQWSYRKLFIDDLFTLRRLEDIFQWYEWPHRYLGRYPFLDEAVDQARTSRC